MPRKGANVTLSSYDEIFTTEEGRTESQQEHVQMIPLSELHPFEGHPFRVVDDEEMQKTVESVKQYGVLTPAIARPDPDGGYEIISGHRRLRASELAGLDKLPVIVREMDDDEAIIYMVDSNLQREHILPSERAFAYKMKLDAIKHQGARTDLSQEGTSSRVGMKSPQALELVGDMYASQSSSPKSATWWMRRRSPSTRRWSFPTSSRKSRESSLMRWIMHRQHRLFPRPSG